MKKSLLSVLMVSSIFSAFLGCTRSENSSNTQFIGGFITGGKRDFPAAVRLDFSQRNGYSSGGICSGTKVSADTFMTAAHCVLFVRDEFEKLKEAEVKLAALSEGGGENDAGKKQLQREISDLKEAIKPENALNIAIGTKIGITAAKTQSETVNGRNPDFSLGVVDYWMPLGWDGSDINNDDIVLIKVDSGTPNIGIAKLFPIQSFDNLPVFKTGYGCEKVGGGVPTVKFKFAPSYVLERSKVSAAISEEFAEYRTAENLAEMWKIMAGMIFTSPRPLGLMDAATCPGDSGSAVYVPDSTSLSSSLVIGVVSGGFTSKDKKRKVVDFATSVLPHIGAIESFIAKPTLSQVKIDTRVNPE